MFKNILSFAKTSHNFLAANVLGSVVNKNTSIKIQSKKIATFA